MLVAIAVIFALLPSLYVTKQTLLTNLTTMGHLEAITW